MMKHKRVVALLMAGAMVLSNGVVPIADELIDVEEELVGVSDDFGELLDDSEEFFEEELGDPVLIDNFVQLSDEEEMEGLESYLEEDDEWIVDEPIEAVTEVALDESDEYEEEAFELIEELWEEDEPSDDDTSHQFETIQFGFYPYTKVSDSSVKAALNGKTGRVEYNGKTYVSKEDVWYIAAPINWIVVSRNEDRLFVISERILEEMGWNNDGWYETPTWADCRIRKWCNNEFYDYSFTDNEKNCIQQTSINTSIRNETIETTEDNVFIPSLSEVKMLDNALAYPANYMSDSNKPSSYYIRILDSYLLTLCPGHINAEGKALKDVPNATYGIRPAMYVDTSQFELLDYNPFEAIGGEEEPSHQGFIHSLDYYATTTSSVYNPELACDLMKLAWDAYGPNTKKDEHNVGSDEDIKADYKNLGFDVSQNYYSKNYSQWGYFEDYCGFSFAAKGTIDGGQIVIITIRGTVGGLSPYPSPEWISNLLGTVPGIFENSWHQGFYKPACDIIKALESKNLIKTSSTKYFITGHSRGAGVGNVLSVLLSQKGISKDNLYDYNFACPDTKQAELSTDWSGGGRYNNIFNINAANDLVGVVPGTFGSYVGTYLGLIKEAIGSLVSSVFITWGKYGKTYFYSFNWNSTESSRINIGKFLSDHGSSNPHQPSLYYEYLCKKNGISSFKPSTAINVNSVFFLKSFMGFCPVDMTIVDSNSVDVVSVKNGTVVYHNTYGMDDAIVMTDGDFKVFFVDPSIDCRVKIKATDNGKMTFVSGLININTEKVEDEKHFENVQLERGKEFLSEGLSQTSAENVRLYTIDANGTKIAEINTNGEEIVIKPTIVQPKAPVEQITVPKKPTLKKLAATKNKITVKWSHFKHTSKKTKKIWKKIKKVQIQCATDKGFKNIVKTTMVNKSKASATVKGLKKNTTYYVRVRYYDGKGYSKWSSAKKIKTKKK